MPRYPLLDARRLGAAVLGLAVLTAPIAHAQQWSGSSSPEDLRYRLDILDAELADIRARLGGASVASPSAPVSGGGNLAGIEGELRRVTAQVEQLQIMITRMQEDATRRIADLEFRITELEGGDPAQSGQAQPLGGQPVTAFPSSGGGVQVAATSVSEQGDFDRAVRDVQQGRFDQAEDRLRRFLSNYPNSPLTPDAHFWMGESQFARGSHADAAKSYLDGYRTQPRGPRAPHNLFKLGLSLGRLGQLNEACQTLRQVRVQFPGAPDDLVARADREADQLACG